MALDLIGSCLGGDILRWVVYMCWIDYIYVVTVL